MTEFNLYLGIAINGLFTGLGVAIGTYLANRYIIKKVEDIEIKVGKLIKRK